MFCSTQHHSAHSRAFTLIELLIVVAIIAILAAIAVPNFLEAQVRSKVSRVKADQRTFATAIETYRVDYNRAPLTRNAYEQLGANVANMPGNIEFIVLTTPVAYLTSIPLDPFVKFGAITSAGPAPNRKDYEYVTMQRTGNPAMRARAMGYEWAMISIGPSRSKVDQANPSGNVVVTQVLIGTAPLFVYDPTNGTISDGYIWRTNKGIYGGEDYPN